MALRTAVRDAMADVQPGQHVVIACSGGPDSLALAGTSSWVAERQQWKPIGVVIDHQLQAGSAQVAATAADQCRLLGIAEVLTIPVEVGATGGPEAAARDARRAVFDEVAGRYHAAAVLLGHTQDDQAETVLLGLARGSGARSLSAMAPVSGLLRRPFLQIPRTVVHQGYHEMCDPLGISAWSDPHNLDPAYTRSRLRAGMEQLQQLLGAALPGNLARTSRLLRDDADALDGWAAAATAELVAFEQDRSSASLADLQELPRAVRTRVLITMCRHVGCQELAFDHVQSMERLISTWHGQGPVNLPVGVTAQVQYARLFIWSDGRS